MPRKDAEREFASFAKAHSIWAHKWADVRRCDDCQKKLVYPQRVEEDDQRPIPASIVDYLAWAGRIIWVECKGQHDQLRFAYSEIDPKQRSFLNDWVSRNELTTLFVLLGAGKPPKGRRAYWISWPAYLAKERARQLYTADKSWDFEDFDADFERYALRWESGVWLLPYQHPIVNVLPGIFSLPSLFLENA